MSVVKRKNEYIGLENLDVLVEDTSFDSTYFRVLECPSILTQGKSSFLIGGSNFLKPGVEIKLELVHDVTKEVIYTQAIFGHLEGDLRRVSIEVYNDVVPGPSTLYVVGELDPETSDVPIPTEWENVYNVRWSKQISINGMGVNTQPIYFYKQPSINVSEIFRGYLDTPTIPAVSVYLTGSGEPRQGLSSIAPSQEKTGDGKETTATYPEKDFADKAKQSVIEENKLSNKLSGREGHIGSKGKSLQTLSPVPNDYLISVNSSSPVSSSYVGQTFTINNPQVDSSKFTLQSYHSVPTVYTSSVMKVLNSTTFVPSDVFYINDTRTSPATLVPAPISNQYITASYQDLPSQTTSSINYFSFADVELSDLKTFSGDVHKVKVYAKSEGSLGDFEKIYDSPIESSEILFDNNDVTLLGNVGYLKDQSRIDKYWELYQGNDGNGGTGTLSYDTTYLIDSVKVSGSNREYEDELRIQLKNDVDFVAGNLYSFRAKLYGKKSNKKNINGTVSQNGEFKIYVSGSAFNKDTTEANHWGVEKLSVPDFPSGVSEYDFGIVEGDFIADNTGTGRIQFKVSSGEWHVSDISVKASSDTAFNPDYVRVVAPMPALRSRPDKVRFLVEFYDVNNNIADTVIFSDFFTFEGENTAIGGTDNILSGSMFIGNALAAGIEMAGVTSAYVRSMGYYGFTSASDGTNSGFLMWSGSVLPDSGDNYSGVGLELVAHSESYLRYRTNPSELDIRANAFFVGNETSQFISGSGNNIEISSSNFHVQPNGNVTMQGTITADAGNIGDWQIVNGMLSGSNATLDALGAALYKSDQGPTSNPTDGYYIDFTPGGYYVRFGTDFAVSSSGQLIASGAKIEGVLTSSEGYIANWTIAPNTIHKLTATKYTGLSATGDTRFFAGASSLTTTGSAPFNVKSTGDISGSQVLFTGGKIAGFTIDGTQLKQGTSFYLDGDSSGTYFISSSNFQVRPDGDVSGSQVLFTGGKVGGWTLTDTTLTGGVVTLDSAGSIEVGGLSDATTVATTNSGFFADSSGNVLIKGNVSGNDYLKVSSGGGIDIKTQTFDLDASTVVIDSATNSGKIALGASPNSSVAGTNKGIYMDGQGDFLAYGDAKNYIKFDASATSIDMKSDTFGLGTATMVISSSVNNGTIRLGSGGGPIAHNTDAAGIYMDGQGRFQVYGNSTNYLRWDGSDLTVKGDLTVDNIRTPATIGGSSSTILNASSSITSEGYARFVSASIGGFNVSDSQINDDNSNLILKSSGQISASEAQITGKVTATSGQIAGWDITGNTLVSSNNDSIVMDGDNERISINSQTYGNTGIQLEYNSGTPRAFIGKSTGGFLKFDGANVEVSSSKFMLGDLGTNFVSGSDSNIEISSSKFHLKNDGDIVVSKVSATEGSIGGFNVVATKLNSTSGNIEMDGGGGQIVLGAGLSAYPNSFIHLKANLSAADGNMLGIGNSTLDNCPFLVNGVGKMTATSALVSGSDVNIEVPSFFMGATGSAFISGSSGNLEVSSSKWQLQADGDAILNDMTGSNVLLQGRRITFTDSLGNSNIALGHGTFVTSSNATYLLRNVAIGEGSMRNVSNGNDNVRDNISIGTDAMGNEYEAEYNIAIGNSALKGDALFYSDFDAGSGGNDGTQWAKAQYNIAIGYEAMGNGSATDPVNIRRLANTAIGYRALKGVVGSHSGMSIAIGMDASLNVATASYGVAIGVQAEGQLGSSFGNVSIGYQAMYSNAAPHTSLVMYGIHIGFQSTTYSSTATDLYGIAMGYQSKTNGANSIAIGKSVTAGGENQINIGNTSHTHFNLFGGDFTLKSSASGSLNAVGNVNPDASATYDLGTTALRWRNIYTTDLQLSNMDRDEGNKVDGTKGDWTLQEGEEDLFVINNISGKKYKIALIPQDDESDNRGDP